MVERLAQVLEKLVKEDLKTTLDVLESKSSSANDASSSASHPRAISTSHQSR